MNKKLCYFFPCSKGRLFDVCGSYIYKFTNVCIPYDSAKQLEEVLAICTPNNLNTSLNLLYSRAACTIEPRNIQCYNKR